MSTTLQSPQHIPNASEKSPYAAPPSHYNDGATAGQVAQVADAEALCGGVEYDSRVDDEAELRLHKDVVENFRELRVIVIGAGYSGIYHGIRIPERLKNCKLTIYEKNAGVGGTWYENRYPGCACDIPSHSYQYYFNPNPNWSSLYAPSHEIRAYIEATAEKYSVNRFIKLQHEVTSCNFDKSEGKWHVAVKTPYGQVIEDTADVLISARGTLNHIAWPEIDGLRSFQGELMHSAQWNEDYDFKNKRVGIIGSGSSAIQIIPQLQKVSGTNLSCFIRSKTWIAPPFGQAAQEKLGMSSVIFSEEQKSQFRADPQRLDEFRTVIETDSNDVHALTINGTDMQKAARQRFEQGMKDRLQTKPEYYDWLKPDFSPGCRRLTPGPGFLEALVQDNVDFVRDRISKVEPRGVVTADGKLHEVDVLVCATGFHTAAPPPFPMTGIDGKSLGDHWKDRAETYLSLATDEFPNFYTMLGPNGAIGTGSLTMMIECVGDYVIKCIRKQQKENIKSMAIKRGRVRDFSRHIDAYFKNTVYMDDCKSWYRKGDMVTGLWPGSALHCMEALRSPRWEDFEYEYLSENGEEENQLGWLGNGWSVNQVEKGNLAWYLTPRFLDSPNSPFPEAHEGYKIRPFSQ